MADTTDKNAFIAALFEIAKEKRRETIITPWDGKLAMISAHTPDYVHASLDMGVFDIPVDEAKELIKLANSQSIKYVEMPPLYGKDLVDEGVSLDIAPGLFAIWAVGDASPFFQYFAMSGDYISGTGIASAICVAEGREEPEEDHPLEIEPDDMARWIGELAASGDRHLMKFSAFLAERQEYFQERRFDDDGNVLEECEDDTEMFAGMYS